MSYFLENFLLSLKFIFPIFLLENFFAKLKNIPSLAPNINYPFMV